MIRQTNSKKNWSIKELDYDARENLIGFFDLLLKIDQRNHPELYKRPEDYGERKGRVC